MTKQRIEDYLARLKEEEVYDEVEGVLCFRSGGYCLRCYDSAVKIALKFRGLIMGYYSSKNPSAYIAEPFCDGHDFAIISGRFIVDYWAKGVGLVETAVFDLESERDRDEVLRLYGNRATWEVVPLKNEKQAMESCQNATT